MATVNVTSAPIGGAKPKDSAAQKADFTSRISSANELSFGKIEWVAGDKLRSGEKPHALIEVNIARGGKDALKIRYNGDTNTWDSVRLLTGGSESSKALTPSERTAFAKLINGYQQVQAKRHGGNTKVLNEVATQRLASALASEKSLGRAELNSLKTGASIAWAKPLSGQAAAEKAKEKVPAQQTATAGGPEKLSSQQQEVLKLLEKEYRYLVDVKPSEYTANRQETTTAFLKNAEKDLKGMKGEAQQLLGKIILLHAQKSAPSELSPEQLKLANMIAARVVTLQGLTSQQYSPAFRSITEGLLNNAYSKLAGTNLTSVNDAIGSLEKLHKKLLPGAGPVPLPHLAVVTPPEEMKRPVLQAASPNIPTSSELQPKLNSDIPLAPQVEFRAPLESPTSVAPLDQTVTMALADDYLVNLSSLFPNHPKNGFLSNQSSIRVGDIEISARSDSSSDKGKLVVKKGDGPESELQPHELVALNSLVEKKLGDTNKTDEKVYWQAVNELIADHQAANAKTALTAPVPPASSSPPSVPASSVSEYSTGQLDG